MTKKVFLKKWILANITGFLIGYLLYTPIAHGLTGNHGRELNTNQIIAHCVALAVVASILFLFQKSVLKDYISISRIRIILATLAFVLLFWFGYYQTVIPGELDYDILFAYLALGSGLWIGILSFSTNKVKWLIAVLSFPFASFIGEVILFVVYSSFDLNMDLQNSTTNHVVFWITVGITTGLLGGWLSGLVLYKMLPKPSK
ncbi:hypothetical protein [Flagellimonas sp.]|uniref:hypothetical protein n=1 Tax=Flagellimonas sp. TaxID=2058762 RepID=UPI003B521663